MIAQKMIWQNDEHAMHQEQAMHHEERAMHHERASRDLPLPSLYK